MISSDDNAPLPGVTIIIKDTPSKGTVTDLDGNFSLQVNDEDVLIFSYVGFVTQEVPVSGKTEVNVTMPLDVESLDEVVIVGYGEQKKANLTGAIVSVKPDELEDIPTGNLAQTLVGKLAGVQVSRNGTGAPGVPSPLIIRGEDASGNIQRQVLYVIDGVIYTNEQDGTGPSGDEMFNRLDPSEIESISILKDAAAAVYGARAAGGVVVVKTKRGKAGKTVVNYSGSVGVGQPTQIPKMLSGYEHASMLNDIAIGEGNLPGGRPPRASDLFTEEELELIKTRDYDWLDDLFKAAITNRHTLNVSGGSERVRYFVGGNYYYETGNFDNLWYRRYGLRSNIEADLTKDLLFNIGMSFNEGTRKVPYVQGDDGRLTGWFKTPLTAPKWVPAIMDGKPVDIGYANNPYGLLESGSERFSVSNNTNINTSLTYDVPFVKGLKLNTRFSYNLNTSTGSNHTTAYEVYSLERIAGTNNNKLLFEETLSANDPRTINVPAILSESWGKGVNYQLNTSISYANNFGKHNLNALLVYEQADGQSRSLSFNQTGALVDGYPYVWAYSANNITNRGDYDQTGRWGLIGRLNYDYDGKYLFESAFRGEASSKFAKSERFGFFPSVSLGWVISEESFLRDNVGFIDFLKIRTSVGIVGNDNTRPYEHRTAFIPEAQANGPIFGTGNGSLSNTAQPRLNGFTVPSRTWAKVRNLNVGLDARVLDNRLSYTFEYYYNKTYDAFDRDRTYPFVLGNDKPPFENYKVSYSTGVEFMLGWSEKVGQDFGYSFDANFSTRKSRPVKLYQNPAVLGTWVDERKNPDSNQPGYFALGIIRDAEHLAEVEQMYPNQPRDANGFLLVDGKPLTPGMIYYEDVGGPDYSREPDGIIDGNDRGIIAKYTDAPYSYGFTLGASWKGFKVSGSFGGVFGHKVFITKNEQALPEVDENVYSWWSDYWTEENTDAKLPRPYGYGYEGEHSTFWMRDGHTLRLNFLNFSYQMPKPISNRLKLNSWKFYVSVTNVWTIVSPFDYKDPVVSEGYDYPLVRTFNIGTSFSL
ncbi:TonB-dependent receptor [Marinoscillum sp. MHG1-6]|uniref:SusC/RagA family TonB-linked outer membrane protein n=1 Tax=Marinoscillum sp. MHG1-6 TaxID=2959627 RepID=UPI0021588F1D|nr:TonB-dependent receptor [Marinoscillum sp. MHG1-6]